MQTILNHQGQSREFFLRFVTNKSVQNTEFLSFFLVRKGVVQLKGYRPT